MNKYGLIGFPLTHSFSKKFFEEKFEREQITGCQYELFPLAAIQNITHLLSDEPGLAGLNVTIPYKETVTAFLNELDETAKAIGAVNCIKINNGHLKGYNTDAPAFEQSLKNFLTAKPQQAFILGTGGSAKAVAYALNKMDIPYVQVSRQKGKITYTDIPDYIKATNLYINTTPLGMYPQVDGYPDIPYHKLQKADFLFDLVYNPAETTFMKRGKEKGAAVKSGLEMLQLQAEKSWQIWNS